LTQNGAGTKRGTTNDEAYRVYLQGMILSDQRKAEKAIENFEQAVTLDPNYALAWAGLAHAHWANSFQVEPEHINEQYQKTKEAFTKALALDPELSDGYSASCVIKFTNEHDFAGAESACLRAVELDPNSPTAHSTYSFFLVCRGRFDEAVLEIKKAVDLGPTSFLNQHFYGNILYSTRRYDEAVAQYKRLIDMGARGDGTYQWLIRSLDAQGNGSEAFEWFLKFLILKKEDNKGIQRYKTAYKRSGWQGVLVERCNDPENFFRLAGLYARTGNKDKAFEYLERSYQQNSPYMAWLKVEPQLDPIRDDPRYEQLVKRVEGR